MNGLRQRYNDDILPKLQQELGLKNKLAVPRLSKVVISVGLGEAKDDKAVLEKVTTYIGAISGQKAVANKAKKSIANFKVAAGQPVGVMVTLRSERMYAFLDKLFNIVLPKVRDFRGISNKAFDAKGNYNLGLKEQTLFPEVDYKSVDKVRGMAVTIVTTAKNSEESRKLLTYLGMPFRKDAQ